MNARARSLGTVVVLGLALPATTAMGQTPQPVGAQLQVNSYTTGRQSQPAAAMSPSGEFVVVWNGDPYTDQDGDSYGVFGRVFDSSGVGIGTEFQVNTYTTNAQRGANVAMFPGGGFVVSWKSEGQDGDSSGAFAQRYDSIGERLGMEFPLAVGTSGYQQDTSVVTQADGGFFVTFTDAEADPEPQGISGRFFDSSGAGLGEEFTINSFTTSAQRAPDVGQAANGDFIVAWQGYGQDGSSASVQAQRLDSTGTPLGEEIEVNTYTPDRQRGASVAVNADGEFLVVYNEQGGSDGSGTGIALQAFDSVGGAVGGEFIVNDYTTGTQSYPSVRSSGVDEFLVAWSGAGETDAAGVTGQLLDLAGDPIGTQFQVNSYTTGTQRSAVLASDEHGRFLVAWSSEGSPENDDDGRSIQAQLLTTVEGAAIDWADPQDLINPEDVLNDGTALVVAINATGVGGSPTVNGVPFIGSDDLLSGSGTANLLDGSSTGDAAFDVLLGSFDLTGSGAATIEVGGGSLVEGRGYQVQVFYTDVRNGTDARVLRVRGDAGNAAELLSGGSNPARGASTYGQSVIGSFVAVGTSQPLALIPTNFPAAHITAYQLREAPIFVDGFESATAERWSDEVPTP